jgi:hypothetical protein
MRSSSYAMGDPQMPQKLRVTGPLSKLFSASPVIETSLARKPTKADTGAPVALRQSEQ